MASTPSTTTDDIVDRHLNRACERSHIGLLGRVDAPAKGGEGHRSIHRTGVEILQTEPLGDRTSDGALACAGWSVDGDDHRHTVRFTAHQDTPNGRPSS